MIVLPGFMSVCVSSVLGLELQTIVNCCMGSRNWTQVLWRKNVYSQLQQQPSSPKHFSSLKKKKVKFHTQECWPNSLIRIEEQIEKKKKKTGKVWSQLKKQAWSHSFLFLSSFPYTLHFFLNTRKVWEFPASWPVSSSIVGKETLSRGPPLGSSRRLVWQAFWEELFGLQTFWLHSHCLHGSSAPYPEPGLA